MGHVFAGLSDRTIGRLVGEATQRVVLAAASVQPETATALKAAVGRLGAGAVSVVLDVDEKVFRLGYGTFGAVSLLRESGCEVRHAPGLRIGALVVDDSAWVFAPAALYVEEDTHSDETPNAVRLDAPEADRLAMSICPRLGDRGGPGAASPTNPPLPDIGLTPAQAAPWEQVRRSLEVAPPVAFDVVRHTRVFEPYIQYVEISLTGAAVQRHRVTLPPEILAIQADESVAKRLHTTFELIERGSAVSSGLLDADLRALRERFTRSLGEQLGRVILRAQRGTFDALVLEFASKVDAHKASVIKQLQDAIKASREQIIEAYLPIIRERPPPGLLGQITTLKPTDDQIRRWIDSLLDRAFPRAEELVGEMVFQVTFRDVTYETLKMEGFAERLRRAFPFVEWDKPFNEFRAAFEHQRKRS